MEKASATFFWSEEDDTLGNLIRSKLLEDSEVIFAGYKVPHPLTRSVQVRVQTMGTPAQDSLAIAVDSIVEDLDTFNNAFNEAIAQ